MAPRKTRVSEEPPTQYRYKISLRAFHPHLAAEKIVAAIGLPAVIAQTAAGPRLSRKGPVGDLIARESFVLFELVPEPVEDLEACLKTWVSHLQTRRRQVRRFVASGGLLEFFVGFFVESNSGIFLKRDLLAALGSLGVSLSLDVYPPDD